ncbi:MBL fold metallo-hydrolase [Vulcanisaeta distributa]|uniref:MBL fold metallo-hydrolase n=1 Tax=Vulcanisaeta distributa TaxID=164451 RepID=UPI001FB454CF|nr:MBL fold metallo-hydrolase [Vulcanisaeta distributa]
MDFSGARYTPQDLVFSESLTLYAGDRAIEVKYIGYPAHTVGDVYVYIPDSRVVFTGDLLFAEPCTPFVLFGSVSGSIEALDRLASLNADIYVPGHGPPVSYGRKALYRARDYLVYIRMRPGDTLRRACHFMRLPRGSISWNSLIGTIRRGS